MTTSRLALPLLFASALAACAGPNVATTSVSPVTPPPAWRTDADTAAPLQRDWWQSFGDPALAALVEKALANNSDIGLAAARVRERTGQKGKALFHPIRLALTGESEGLELDLAVPAIEAGASLQSSSISSIPGAAERAQAFASALK